jgi:hypothetical protein
MVRLGIGVRVNAAGATYVSEPTFVLGPIPPDYFVPGVVTRGTIGTTLTGDPISLTTDGDTAWNTSIGLPWKVERVDFRALTAVTTANMILDVQHDTGTSWPSIFSATSNTTKPQLSATSSVKSDSATPDGAYWLRCFAADDTGLSPANSTVGISCIQVAGTGGKNPNVKIRALSYQPPLQSLRAVGNYK